MSVDELSELLAGGLLARGGRLIDVREVDEYVEAHVPGAVLVSLSTVSDHVDAFRGDGPAYIICKSGGRSLMAAEFLAAHDVAAINVAGGTLAWIRHGFDTVAGTQLS